jgi:hypothetical protein
VCKIHDITLRDILGDASLTGLPNGSTASSNVSSLVNLSGHQPMVSQTVASAIPTAGNTLIGNILINIDSFSSVIYPSLSFDRRLSGRSLYNISIN